MVADENAVYSPFAMDIATVGISEAKQGRINISRLVSLKHIRVSFVSSRKLSLQPGLGTDGRTFSIGTMAKAASNVAANVAIMSVVYTGVVIICQDLLSNDSPSATRLAIVAWMESVGGR